MYPEIPIKKEASTRPRQSTKAGRRVVVTCPSCGVRTFRRSSLIYICEGCAINIREAMFGASRKRER